MTRGRARRHQTRAASTPVQASHNRAPDTPVPSSRNRLPNLRVEYDPADLRILYTGGPVVEDYQSSSESSHQNQEENQEG